MPAAVIQFPGTSAEKTGRQATRSLLEAALPGRTPVPLGILMADEVSGDFALRLRSRMFFGELEEDQGDFLDALGDDLWMKAREMGGRAVLDSLEDGLSHFLRISDRTPVACRGTLQQETDRLFARYVEGHVEAEIRPYVTHLPLYGLRAAATKFGEGMESELETWVRVPENLRLTEGMFVARVVGPSMEPLIPDGSLCIFRAPVTGSRQGRRLLIENFGETDFSMRYTVKRYARRGALEESAERTAPIRLEPLNREFEAFDLTEDRFRVVAEFVQVLDL